MTAPATHALASRSRPASAEELHSVPWLPALEPAERERAVSDMRVVNVAAGEYVCRIGRPVTYWFGVLDGLLKMSSDTALGVPITFTGLPPGGWFGEGTVLKREPYRYNIQALRKSVVAGITAETFHWLLDRSIGCCAQRRHRPNGTRIDLDHGPVSRESSKPIGEDYGSSGATNSERVSRQNSSRLCPNTVWPAKPSMLPPSTSTVRSKYGNRGARRARTRRSATSETRSVANPT